MEKKTKFFLIVSIIFLIVVLFFSIFRQEKEKEKEKNENKIITNFSEGIIITKENEEKILRDENEKFELKMKDNWKITRPANILEIVIEEDEYYSEAQKSFFIFKNDIFKDNFDEDVEKWTAAQNNICPKCYSIEEYKNLNGLEVAVVRDNVAINDQKFILFVQGEYLYGIFTTNMNFEEINSIIKDIKFLE